MPAYVLLADMTAEIPLKHIIEALDDDGDGAADSGAWEGVAKAVATEIDGILGVRYPVPFANPLPAAITSAAQVLAGEKLYTRRAHQTEATNPFAARAKAMRTRLEAIAKGDVPLHPEIKRAAPSASLVSEPSRASSTRGRNTA